MQDGVPTVSWKGLTGIRGNFFLEVLEIKGCCCWDLQRRGGLENWTNLCVCS